MKFLNTYEVIFIPPHKLILKFGVPIMLLRNLNPTKGLCNDTRLIVRDLKQHIIKAEIITGTHLDQIVYIS